MSHPLLSKISAIAAGTVIACSCQPGLAQVRLPHLFGDGMVVQRDKPIRVWGWAAPGEAVRVSFAGTSAESTADGEGRWNIELAAQSASAKGRELLVVGSKTRRQVRDVLVGEVWVCGGQSNMAWTLRSSRDADVEVPSANFPGIRYLRMPMIARLEPQSDFPVDKPDSEVGNWRRCVGEESANCTGVGYYFARRLHRRLKVPIGIIDTSWGGTMAQHWVTKKTLESIPEMRSYLDKFITQLATWHAGGADAGAKQRYDADVANWQKLVTAQAKDPKNKARKPRKPNWASYTNPADKGQPGGMYNGVLAPIARFVIKGVLFYQGENNSFGESWKPFPYTFPSVISDWRQAFGQADLPFGIIQIAGWSTRRSMHYDMNHHCNIVREVQFRTWQATPGTGLIVTFDTNSNGSIHPGRKLPVGERSARWALAEVYDAKPYRGRGKLEWRGPIYQSFAADKSRIRISFREGTARGLRLDQDMEIGFYVAGEDKVFHHARARIDGGEQQVVVWSDAVKTPIAVRYGWSNLPVGGLMNGRELPAYPFRTDTWPMVPHQSKGAYEVEKLR